MMIPVPLDEVLSLAAGLEQAGRGQAAGRLADHILAVQPNQPAALHLKGVVTAAQGDAAGAAALIEQAIRHGLEEPHYYRNICAIYERLGRLDDALAAGRRSVELDPTNAESYHNLTVVHARRLDFERATACARTALGLDPSRPGAHMALAEALLAQGQFQEGWQEYEWRFRLPGAALPLPDTGRPQWDGSAMAQERLLLVADQGFGDVIQFCRYIPWVRTLCPDIAVAAGPEMQPFIRQVAPDLPVFAEWRHCPPYAAYCPLSGLPLRHGTRLTNIPAPIPYLRADPERAAGWRARLQRLRPRNHRAVGLVWAGRSSHPNDRSRSVRLSRLAALFSVPATSFVALQKGPGLAEAARLFGRAPLFNVSADIRDFADTAAVLNELDLLITVDTSVAHLAGALGRPVWLMLPHAADWRWLLNRTDSPWYPTFRLFRQNAADDWEGVASSVASALMEQAPPLASATP